MRARRICTVSLATTTLLAGLTASGTANAWTATWSGVQTYGGTKRLPDYSVAAQSNMRVGAQSTFCLAFEARWRKNNTLSPDQTVARVPFDSGTCAWRSSNYSIGPKGVYHGDYRITSTYDSFTLQANG